MPDRNASAAWPPHRIALGAPVLSLLLAGLAAAASSAPALAQDKQLDPTIVTGVYVPSVISQELSDPTYLPAPGQLFGSTEFGYSALRTDIYTGAGAFSSHDHADTTDVLQRLSYGVIKNLAVTAEAGFGYEGVTDEPADKSARTSHGDGFSDPSFAATYRALRQGQAPVTLDFIGAYAPELITAHTVSAGANGVLARGGDLVRLTAALARVNAYETIQAYVSADHHGSAKKEGGSANNIYTDAYWSPSIGLATQTRLTPRIALNLNGSYLFNETTNLHFEEDDSTAISHLGAQGLVTAELIYRVIPFRLDASVEYGHVFYGNASTDYIGDPAADTYTHRSDDRAILRLRYRLR